MASVLVACAGVYGVLGVPDAMPGPTARALVVDSIENPRHKPDVGDWQGYDAWQAGLGDLEPGEVSDLGARDDGLRVVEISGLRFQRALIDVVREAYPGAVWSAGHDDAGLPVARAEHDGRAVGLVMGLQESMRRWDLES